VYRS